MKTVNQGLGRMPGHFRLFGLALAAIAWTAGAAPQDRIGSVTSVQGNLTIVRDGGNVAGTIGSELRTTDVLRTADASKASVALLDGTRVLLGPNSQLAMETYTYDSESRKGSMVFNFAKGTMRMITGAITKGNPEQAVLKTPGATAGIRGTDFIVDVPDNR